MFFFKKEETLKKYQDIIFKIIEELEKENIKISEKEPEKIVDKIKELIQEDKRWKEFKKNYPAAFFTVKKDRKLIEWNKYFEELTGWSHYELENIKNREGVAAQILWSEDPSKCKVCKVVKKYDHVEKKPGYADAEIINKSGERIPVFVYVVPLFINGMLDRTYVILRDRRREYKERDEYFQKILEPIIKRLIDIQNKDLRKLITINNKELKGLEKPINDLIITLQNLTKNIVKVSKEVEKVTSEDKKYLDKKQNG